MSSSSVQGATHIPHGAAILAHPVNRTLIALYQAGSEGATGLVFRTSSDLGGTWSAETQVSPMQDVVPAGVISLGSGDVHLVYARLGDPQLDAGWSAWYRPLIWGGSGWTVGPETVIAQGSSAEGFSNPSVAVDEAGFITVALARRTSSGVSVRTLVSSGALDLSTPVTSGDVSLPAGGPPSIALRRLSGLGWWAMVVRQDSSLRIYRSTAIISSTQSLHSWTHAQTVLLPQATDEFDAAWNPDPDDSSDGQLGLVYRGPGGAVLFRRWTALTNSLSSPITVSAAGSYPSVSRYFGEWIVGWIEELSPGQRALYIAYTGDPATRLGIDTDPDARGWAWLRLCDDVSRFDALLMQWSETLDPESDGYAVYLGSLTVASFRRVEDSSSASEDLVFGPAVEDQASAAELIGDVLDAQRSASDSSSSADSLLLEVLVDDLGAAEETLDDFLTGLGEADTATASELLELSASASLADSASASELVELGLGVDASDSGSALESIGRDAEVIEPLSDPSEHLLVGVLIAELFSALDRIVAGPDAGDSVAAQELLSMSFEVLDSAAGMDFVGYVPDMVDGDSVVSDRRRRRALIASVGETVSVHSGILNGWILRGDPEGQDELRTRMFTFEDVNPDYAGIVFLTVPTSRSEWGRCLRSDDGGRTFRAVGPEQMACIALAADGSLWAVGNDGTSPPGASGSGRGPLGWRVSQRHVFRSIDLGRTWARVFSDDEMDPTGRCNSYVHIAADPSDPRRIMALGVSLTSEYGDEIRVAATSDGGNTWATRSLPASQVSNFPVFDWAYHSDSVLLALGSGRFALCGTRTDLTIGQEFAGSRLYAMLGPWTRTLVTTGDWFNPIRYYRWSRRYARPPIMDAVEMQISGVRHAVALTPNAVVRENDATNASTWLYLPSSSSPFNLSAMAVSGTIAFVADARTPCTVYSVNLATMTATSSIALPAGDGRIMSMCIVGSTLYASTDRSPGRIVAIDVTDPSAMSRIGHLDLDPGENLAVRIVSDGSRIYAITSTAPAILVVLDASSPVPTRVSAHPFAPSENFGVDLDVLSGRLYAVTHDPAGQSWLVRWDVSGTPTREAARQVSQGAPLAVAAVGGYACVAATSPGNQMLAMKFAASGTMDYRAHLAYGYHPQGVVRRSRVDPGWLVIGASMSVPVIGSSSYYWTNSWPESYGPNAVTGRVYSYDVSGSSIPIREMGPATIWTTDDLGATWTARYSDSTSSGSAAPFVDGVVRNGVAYVVRHDPSAVAMGRRILRSGSRGASWTAIPEPGTPGDEESPARYSAVALDHALGSLYIGTTHDPTAVWRMDDPPSGTWRNITENLVSTTGDETPQVSFRGLGILKDVIGLVDIDLEDAGGGAETLSIAVRAQDQAVALDGPPRPAVMVDDLASILESLSIRQRTGYTVRLMMCSGRYYIRLEGSIEPTVPTNPTR